MCHIVFAGAALPDTSVLAPLYRQGYLITLAPGDQFRALERTNQPCLIVLTLRHRLDVLPFQSATPGAPPWLAWNQADDPALSLAAYDAGAGAVLPGAMSPAGLLRAIQHALGQSERPAGFKPLAALPRTRRYKRGEAILIEPQHVGLIERGQVVQTALHPDGSEVVLGFLGLGALVGAAQHDYFALHTNAHTDVQLTSRAWATVEGDPRIGAMLRKQTQEQQAWAAVQGHPQIQQRILGILNLLADRFGQPDSTGLVIDLRLTHAHLAAAVGATRSTVTRALGELRAAGHVATIGGGANERFHLPQSRLAANGAQR